LERGGVTAELHAAPIVVAVGDAAEAAPIEHELQATGAAGNAYGFSELSAHELREVCPVLSDRARHGLRLEGQRYLQPLAYTRSLAESVSSRGGQINAGARVDRVEPAGGGGGSGTPPGTAARLRHRGPARRGSPSRPR